MKVCKQCSTLLKRQSAIYCSNMCQSDYRYHQYIERWIIGHETGDRGVTAKNISKHVRRYILDKYDSSCTICGWNEVNPYTKSVTVEIDHIDGDSTNNTESNLRLLCPNCHSLTASFRNLNRGNGRVWRRMKYIKIAE